MKRLLAIATVVVVGFSTGVAAAEAEAQGTTVASSITAVTVYADRARVTRSASVKLPAGEALFRFAGLPGWLDEASVRVSLTPPDGATVTDVRTTRTYLAQATDGDVVKAEAAVTEISDQLAELDDERKVLEAKAKQIEQIRAFSLDKLPQDMLAREMTVETYASVVEFVAKGLSEVAKARREIDVRRRDLQPELDARKKTLNDMRKLAMLEVTTVAVRVSSPRDVDAQLQVVYMLPGATWEPVHELRASHSDDAKVALTSYAVVSQTTGEDWTHCALSFSTQSSADTVRIPEIDALLLGEKRRPGIPVQTLAGAATFERANKAFLGQNVLYFNFNNPDADAQRAYLDNQTRQSEQQYRATALFEELQERGTMAHFAGAGKTTVRSDGMAIRVETGKVELPAQVEIVAAPEVSLNAARTARLVNTGTHPILPGKVSLFRDGAFLGVTDVEFTAEGEPFALFLGMEDQIKLSRMLDRRESALLRGRRTRVKARFVITVENLAPEPVSLKLTDRVPVSQRREIEVSRVRLRPKVEPDSRGLVVWDLRLEPGEKQELVVEYTIEYPPNVVHQVDASAPEEADLNQQIQILESKF